MPVARTPRFSRPVPVLAALLAGGGLVCLSGCGTSPETVESPRTAEAPAAGEAATQTHPRAVPVQRMTHAAKGAPPIYTLMLVSEAGTLPEAVTGALKPDFEHESVIFLGMGEQEGEGYGVRIIGVQRQGDELTVAAEFERPDGEAQGEITTPWAAVVIPRPEGVSGPLLSDFR